MPSRLYVRELPPVHRMELLTSVDPDLLRWIRVDAEKHEFDLKAGDAVVAALRWKSALGSMATVVTAEAKLTIKRTGFLNPRITVRDAASGKDMAHLDAHPSRSTLVLAGGTTYDWHRTGLLVPGWHFRDRHGTEVLSLEPVREGLRLEGSLVEVTDAGRKLPQLLLLLLVGFYFIALAWLEDQAAAASSALLTAAVGP
ncbi:MAG: hypothetical protein WCA77_02370 [Thermoplasmata archaeon]